MKTLAPDQRKVLTFLAGRYSVEMGFFGFAAIVAATGLDRRRVRLAPAERSSARALTEFSSGLWADDGSPAGSGYAATKAGVEAMAREADVKRQPADASI